MGELLRMGRNIFEVLVSAKGLIGCGSTSIFRRNKFNLLGDDGNPTLFAPVMLAALSTCAQLECDDIIFRLQSRREQSSVKGGELDLKQDSTKSADQKKAEYKETIPLLKKSYAISDVSKLIGKGVSAI